MRMSKNKNNKVTCAICNEDISEYVRYTFQNETGKQITVCDKDYQEFGGMEKVNGEWKEFIHVNEIKYYMVKIVTGD
jgi:hypothetical protein